MSSITTRSRASKKEALGESSRSSQAVESNSQVFRSTTPEPVATTQPVDGQQHHYVIPSGAKVAFGPAPVDLNWLLFLPLMLVTLVFLCVNWA